MRYILLSADAEPTLYEAPDAIAERLSDLAFRFLDAISAPDSGFFQQVRDVSGLESTLLRYDEQDFLAWLNRLPEAQGQPVREPDRLPPGERENIMETARRERYLPYEQQQYPWFNF